MAATMNAITQPDGPGGPDSLVLGTAPKPVATGDQVLIKIHTTGINRADTLQRKGVYPPPPGASTILGLECTGVVEALGPDAKRFSVGERVMALLGGGGYAEYINVSEAHVMHIPTAFTFVQAAAITETWITAFQLLQLGQTEAGNYVLVHAAGSSVGIAAIQLATKLYGAKVIATAGSQEKLDSAQKLGAIAGFNRKEPWAEKVLEATEGKGIDVVLDCVGGSYVAQNSQVLAMEARWVLYGLMGGPKTEEPILRNVLKKRASLIGTTLRTRSHAYKANLIAEFEKQALPHFDSGEFSVLISNVLPLAKAGEAHAIMEANANLGKIVLEAIPAKDEL